VQHPRGAIRFLLCPACGSWCQSPQITVESLCAWYDSDSYQGSALREGQAYGNYEADEPQRRAEATVRFKRDILPVLERHPSRILEIGCASASLLAEARRAGHTVTGVDLSARFAEQARRLNDVEVLTGDFLDVALSEGSYDAVVLLGTVSNLPDLGAAFARIGRLLRKGGVVVLNFPDCRSWPAVLYGRRFWMFVPSAITFASARGVTACAAAHGLRIERMRTDWQRPSLGKLLKHTRMSALLPAALRSAIASWSLPLSIPIPAVRVAWLRAV
jgi:SAM-dependent methyltransferase